DPFFLLRVSSYLRVFVVAFVLGLVRCCAAPASDVTFCTFATSAIVSTRLGRRRVVGSDRAGACIRGRADQGATPQGTDDACLGQGDPANQPRELLECGRVRKAGGPAAALRVLRRGPLQERRFH